LINLLKAASVTFSLNFVDREGVRKISFFESENLFNFLHPNTEHMKTVADILNRKGAHVEIVSPNTPVIDALKVMAEKQIGSVVVMDGDEFCGIMTERDYSRKVVLKGRSSDETTVADIMSSDFPRVTKQDKVAYCLQLLSTQKLRYLPVFQGNRLEGIISINDVVTETIQGQSEMISYLQSYIQS